MAQEIQQLSPQVHDLLRSRLAQAETPEEEQAWIDLARFARERLDFVLTAGADPVTDAMPRPVSSGFNKFQAVLEEKAEALSLTPHLPALRQDLLKIRANLFGGLLELGLITEIHERVTLGNEGARGDLADLLSLLGGVGMPDYQNIYALSDKIFDKATDPDLLITLGNTLERLGTDEGKSRAIAAYRKAFLNLLNSGVSEEFALRYKDLADKLRKLGDHETAKAVYLEAAKNFFIKFENLQLLSEIAYSLKEMDFLKESAEVLHWAADCTEDLDDLEAMAKEMNTTLKNPNLAIAIHKRMIALCHDAKRLIAWAVSFTGDAVFEPLASSALEAALPHAEEEGDLREIASFAKTLDCPSIAIKALLKVAPLVWENLKALRDLAKMLVDLGGVKEGIDVFGRVATLEEKVRARGEAVPVLGRSGPPTPPSSRASGQIPAPVPASGSTPPPPVALVEPGEQAAARFFGQPKKR